VPNELFTETGEANTPETLGVTPRYVLQHNAISRSVHNLSATAKKLTAMAMSLLPADLSSLTAAFTFADFCKAIGYDKGGESFKLFQNAVDECMGNYISIETISKETGKKDWEKYTWFSSSKFNSKTGVATMTFSGELAAILAEMKRVYAKINLRDMGELQSKYALRIFEVAKSYESLRGKDGNNSQTWYFERSVQELRSMLGVSADSYSETKEFRKYVIERPVKEINESGIGLEINTEGVKQGRRLAAIRFDCKQTARTASKKGRGRKKGTPQPELPKANPKTEGWREEKELRHLKELHPEEFAAFYAEALAKTPAFMTDMEFGKITAEAAALMQLKEKYGVVK
jgi:plasmid replication initiation protein